MRSVQTSYPAPARRAPYQAVIALSSGLAWLMKTTFRSARGVIAARPAAVPPESVPAPCDSLLSMAAIVEESYRASNPASPETIGRWSGRRGIARLGGHACRALPAFAWNNHESRLMFDWINSGKAPEPRKGMPSPRLGEGEFKRQFRAQFQDQAFTPLAQRLDDMER